MQDADLEYDLRDLRKLLDPLIAGNANVVLGSRFTSVGAHRVPYFWHYLGNRLLTFISNMFTDLNLTDMETCYKVFTRGVIKNIKIEGNRLGFEPEIVAKIVHQRLRIYEMVISYSVRTYEEGKKIGFMDGLRALFCAVRYNSHKAPLPLQFMVYLGIGASRRWLITWFLCSSIMPLSASGMPRPSPLLPQQPQITSYPLPFFSGARPGGTQPGRL